MKEINKNPKLLLLILVIISFYLSLYVFSLLNTTQTYNNLPIWNFRVHHDPAERDLSTTRFNSVSISSDGTYIAAGNGDGNVYFFHSSSSELLKNYNTDERIFSVDISSDGYYIGAGSNNSIYLFNRTSSIPMITYTIGIPVYSLVLSADGKYLFVGAHNNRLYLFNNSDSNPMWSNLPSPGYSIRDVAISSDGYYMVAGGSNRNIYLFNKTSPIPMWTCTVRDSITSVAMSSDGLYIVAGEYNGCMYLFNKTSPVPLINFSSSLVSKINEVSISSNGEYIVAGGEDDNYISYLFFFHNPNPTPLFTYSPGQDYITSTSLSEDGVYIAIGLGLGGGFLFNKYSSSPLWSCNTYPAVGSTQVDITSNGNYIIMGSYNNLMLFTNEYMFNPPIPFDFYYLLYFTISTTIFISLILTIDKIDLKKR